MRFVLRSLIISALLVTSLLKHTQATPLLSDKAEIYMLTASPGDELYSVFGHSAIWIVDSVARIDNVYNYGTFNFNTPNFYIKFIRGKLHYMLSVSRMNYFLFEYHISGREVVQQKLNLEQDEMQKIFEFLEINRKPENKEYLYDFFFDNCATRIRDVFEDFVEINWHEYPFDFEPKTFRELVKDYVENLPWEHFGIDFLLGYPVDRIATPYEYMFLPDHMYVAFANARRTNGEPLVLEESIMVKKTLTPKKPGFLTPKFVFWFLFFIIFAGLLFKNTRKSFAKTWMFLMGFIGFALLPLFLFSDHSTFNPNFNLLWTVPTHLFFVFNTTKEWSKKYFRIIFLLTFIMVIFWAWLPQKFNPAVFPILLTIIICSAYLAFRYTDDITNKP